MRGKILQLFAAGVIIPVMAAGIAITGSPHADAKPRPTHSQATGPVSPVGLSGWCVTAVRLKTRNSFISLTKCIKGDPFQTWVIDREMPGGYTTFALKGTELCLGQRGASDIWVRLVDCSGNDRQANFEMITGKDHGSWICTVEHLRGSLQLTTPLHFDPRTKTVKLYWRAGGATGNAIQHWSFPQFHAA